MSRPNCILALLALFCALPSGAQEGTLHEDEARLSETLRTRAQAALDARFGPGRSAVDLRVSLGLTPEARGWIERAFKPPAKPGAAGENAYNWAWMGQVAADEKSFVLPGYPDDKKRPDKGGEGSASAPGAPGAPDPKLLRGFGTEVVSIRARVTLDKDLPADAEARAQELVGGVLGLQDSRGDILVVERTALPDRWLALLKDPEGFARIAFRGAVVVVCLLAMLALLSAVRGMRDGLVGASDKLASALRRSAEKTLDLRLGGEARIDRQGKAEVGAAGLLGLDDDEGVPGETPAPRPEQESENVVFSIDPDDAPKLHHLLKDQPPEHVAMILPHLADATRGAFLALMPRARMVEVLGAMVPVRYVDPDLLKTLRSELERRIEGVVGGVESASRFLQELPSANRSELLKMLRERDPDAAAALRERVLLLEDLERLEPADLTTLIGETPLEDIAAASAGLPQTFVAAIVAVFPRRSAQVYKELVELGGAGLAEKAPEARERLLKRAELLMREGRVKRPAVMAGRLSHETKT